MTNTPKPQANTLREKVISAVCFKPGIIGHLEQFERIEALITEARTKGYGDGFQMGQFERDMDNIHGTAQLTPKENK